MARPREFDEVKVLNALRDVFWQHGFEGTSYADIMQATGLKKGSLYAAYGDKRALYLKALEQYDGSDVAKGVAMLRDRAIPVMTRIENLMFGPAESAQTRRGRWGCLLCNAAIDQAPFDKTTETRVMASMARLQEGIDMALTDLPAYARAPKKREVQAAALLAGYFGLRVLVKAGQSKAAVKLAAKGLLSAI